MCLFGAYKVAGLFYEFCLRRGSTIKLNIKPVIIGSEQRKDWHSSICWSRHPTTAPIWATRTFVRKLTPPCSPWDSFSIFILNYSNWFRGWSGSFAYLLCLICIGGKNVLKKNPQTGKVASSRHELFGSTFRWMNGVPVNPSRAIGLTNWFLLC